MLPFMKDAKGEASIIVDKILNGEKTETEVEPAEEQHKEESGIRVAAQEMINAFEMKDAAKLARALRSLIDMHRSEGGEY